MIDQANCGIDAPFTTEPAGAFHFRPSGSTYAKCSMSFILRPSGSHSTTTLPMNSPQLCAYETLDRAVPSTMTIAIRNHMVILLLTARFELQPTGLSARTSCSRAGISALEAIINLLFIIHQNPTLICRFCQTKCWGT